MSYQTKRKQVILMLGQFGFDLTFSEKNDVYSHLFTHGVCTLEIKCLFQSENEIVTVCIDSKKERSRSVILKLQTPTGRLELLFQI